MITAKQAVQRTHPGVEPTEQHVRFSRGQMIKVDGETFTVDRCESHTGPIEDAPWDAYTATSFKEKDDTRYRLVMLFGCKPPGGFDSTVFVQAQRRARPLEVWEVAWYPDDVRAELGVWETLSEVEEGDEIRWDGKREYTTVTRVTRRDTRVYVRCKGSRGGRYRLTYDLNGAWCKARRTSGEGKHLGRVNEVEVRR